jgi:hypothetical protein
MHLVRNVSLLRPHVSIHLLISGEELLLAPGRNLKAIDQRNHEILLYEMKWLAQQDGTKLRLA